MPKLYAARGAQRVKVSEFVFSYNDTMLNTSGALKTLGSVYTDAGTFEIIKLPPGAIISHGEVVVLTTGTVASGDYTLAVGNSTTGDLYLAATTLVATAGTKYPFTMNIITGNTTSVVSAIGAKTGLNVQMTYVNSAANATTGKWAVRVYWTLEGKIDETYPQ
jgi:hypothetical protein